MVKKVILALVLLLSSIALGASTAGSLEHQGILEFLEQGFPDQYKQVGKVTETSENKLLFRAADLGLEQEKELLVLGKQEGQPYYLCPQNSVIRVSGRVQDKYVADILAELSPQKPSVGDSVVKPTSPTLYLYSNIKNRDGFAPYQQLLQGLLDKNFQVVELREPGEKKALQDYSLLLRLEGSNSSLVTKLQSVYSKEVLYSRSEQCQQDFGLNAAAGKDILTVDRKDGSLAIRIADSDKGIIPGAKVAAGKNASQPQKQKSGFQGADTDISGNVIRLDKGFQRLAICQLDKSPKKEFVLLNNNRVQVCHLSDGKLQPVYQHDLGNEDLIGLHLHAVDLDNDAQQELAVTLGKIKKSMQAENTSLKSRILNFEKGGLKALADEIPYYLRVIQDRSGERVLLAQKKGINDPFAGDIHRMTLNRNKEVSTSPYPQASDVYSLYQFNLVPGFPDKVMIKEPSNQIRVYHAPAEKVIGGMDMGLGNFNVLPYPVELQEPEFGDDFEKIASRDCFAPRRFSLQTGYANQVFTINAQRKSNWDLNRLQDLITGQQSKDSLLALKWSSDRIKRTWESQKIDKDILDFAFLHGKKQDQIYVLVRDGQGFALLGLE